MVFVSYPQMLECCVRVLFCLVVLLFEDISFIVMFWFLLPLLVI